MGKRLTVEYYKNNPVDFIMDYKIGKVREIHPHQKKVLDMIESRCAVSLHPRKMIMIATPTNNRPVVFESNASTTTNRKVMNCGKRCNTTNRLLQD